MKMLKKILAAALMAVPLLAFAISPVRDHGLPLTTSGTPSNTIGMIGDVAVDPATGVLYEKDATQGWVTTFTPGGGLPTLTNGQLAIGSTGLSPVAATLTGTANQISVTNGAGSITLGLPSPLTLPGTLNTGLTANTFLFSGAGGALSATAAPTNGQLLIGSTGNAPVAAALTGTANQIAVTNGAGSVTLSIPSTLAIPGTLSSYNGIATAGQGMPFQVAVANFLNQAAALGATTVYAVPAAQAGRYRVTMNTVETQAATTSSTLPNTTVSWTDSDTGVVASANIGSTSAGNIVGAISAGSVTVYAKASTNIQVQSQGWASSGATGMLFTARYEVEYLGQ